MGHSTVAPEMSRPNGGGDFFSREGSGRGQMDKRRGLSLDD